MQTKMLINGELVEGNGPAIDVINPATGAVITSVAQASGAQVDAAVRTSAEAFETSLPRHRGNVRRSSSRSRM